jgi:hypothetical protein
VNSFMGGGANVVFGWEFTTNAAITVTQLGWYDHGFDGLATNHQLGIFDASTMKLLVSTTIGPANQGPIEEPTVHVSFGFPDSGAFRYLGVTPTALAADGDYVIAGTDPIGGQDTTAFYFPTSGINSLTTDPAITFVQGRLQLFSGSALVFPTQLPPVPVGYFGAAFQFQGGPAVPEPSSLVLCGVGFMALAGWGWRRGKPAA